MQESSRKTSIFALMTRPKPLTVWITINCGKFWKRWQYQTTWPASQEICMQVRKQQLELDMEQQAGSKLGKEYVKAVYCHSDYLTYMQGISCKMLGWMKHKLESRLLKEIPASDMQTHSSDRKWRGSKSLLMRVKEESGKSWLNTHYSKNEGHGIQSHHFMANRWTKNGNSERLYFIGLQNHCRGWMKLWNYKPLAPWEKNYDKPWQHIKKQRHYFSDKDPCSQSCGFSSSHVQRWELDHKEGCVLKNWCFWTVVMENSWESLGQQGDPTSPS